MARASDILKNAYEGLMAIQDPEELKDSVLNVLKQNIGTDFTLEDYRRVQYALDEKITLFDVQKYITDFMLAGFGLGVGKPRGHTAKGLHRQPEPWQFRSESVEMVRVDDDIEAIASFLSEDPDEKLYDKLTDEQKAIKEMVEKAGFKVALRESED